MNIEDIKFAKELGAEAGRLDALNYSESPGNFTPKENPFGLDSEPLVYEAWEEAYEDAFEGAKARP